MSIAFYRKYRPKSFKEVSGQEHIVKVLEGAILGDRIFHAYLFTGSRGTGKTSMARIFAKEIGTSEKDIYELDAASNTSVEDIREITEGARTLPFESKKKVYIIDEVHMLSKSAFNAFLKTLEEPPDHSIFILATTESHKLPQTIISRCQSFSFKKPSRDSLVGVIDRVCSSEGYKIDKNASILIATLGDGSFRDTLGLLDQVVNISEDKKITIEDIESLTGAPRGETIHKMIGTILSGDLKTALSLLNNVKKTSNIDIKIFTKLLLRDMRSLLLLKFAPELKDKIYEELTPDERLIFEEMVSHSGMATFSGALKEILSSYTDIQKSNVPELYLELALIKLMSKKDD